MKKLHLAYLLPLLLSLAPSAHSQSSPDSSVMQALKSSLKIPSAMNWSHTNPCQWGGVSCDSSNRVTRIQIPGRNLGGTLPPDLKNLTQLEVLEVMNNQLDGAVPSLSGLNSLQEANFHNNNFSSFPSDFFYGLSSLQSVTLDYNPFASWEIPSSLQDASSLQSFSANGANITGTIPGFLGDAKFPQLTDLHLALNSLVGALPDSFASSSIRSLWLNGQKLNATIDVVLNMTSLSEVWLHGNQFSGPLPDFSQLTQMRNLSLRDNQFTGVVPASLINLPSLFIVNLTNNMLQGPTPKFKDGVIVDVINGSNSFCLDDSGVPCDDRVNILLSIVAAMNYPTVFAQRWKGNDPCSNQWLGITCDKGNITRVNFRNLGLSGTISSNFSMLPSLTYIDLSNNNLTGTIPAELTKLTALTHLDVSNNRLYGKLPSFSQNIDLNTAGNPDIGKDSPSPSGSPGTNTGKTGVDNGGAGGKSRTGIVVGVVVGAVCILGLVGLGVCLFLMKLKRSGRVQSPDTMLIRSQHSDNCDGVKITVTSRTGGGSDAHSQHSSSVPSEIHVVEAGNMVISVEVLRDVTNNFSDENILGRGGFGTVYKGELHDGTKIAVKRMESSMVGDKGLAEFKSEIAVLTKVRHRNLVALLGYCLDGNERLLVFEYMPQGTLSRHLFNWKEEGLKPLEWTRRLTIALDVARGVEYLHNLAHKSFIHRDLKPSNILLGDDLRAKVSDFGLVRLAPEGDRQSIQTRIAGTFGYLAPEYAATGRVTTKVDVFSFGVILMELITGRKALDETQPEESVHLVTWFRRVHVNKDTFEKAIDPMIDLNEETLRSINTVAELAWHCCAREPYQRPEMGHCVNVLSSLAELWKPAEKDPDDVYGIDLDMTLPQALKKWQAFEGSSYIGDSSSSSYLDSTDNTQTSIPTRPAGFAESLTSADGR